MLRLAVMFLVIALIAGVLGFGGIEHYSWVGARILFIVFLILAVLSFVGHGYPKPVFLGVAGGCLPPEPPPGVPKRHCILVVAGEAEK